MFLNSHSTTMVVVIIDLQKVREARPVLLNLVTIMRKKYSQ